MTTLHLDITVDEGKTSEEIKTKSERLMEQIEVMIITFFSGYDLSSAEEQKLNEECFEML